MEALSQAINYVVYAIMRNLTGNATNAQILILVVLLITGVLGIIVGRFIAKRTKPNKLSMLLVWSTLLAWFIPILGVLIGTITLSFTLVPTFFSRKQVLYRTVSTICILLSVLNAFLFITPVVDLSTLNFGNTNTVSGLSMAKQQDLFEKKMECAKYSQSIINKLDAEKQQQTDSSMFSQFTFHEDFLLIFYSPKLNTCLYATRAMGTVGDGSVTIRDALTNERIKTFPNEQTSQYAHFLYEYSGGEIKQ